MGLHLCACTTVTALCVPCHKFQTFKQFDSYGNSFEHQGIGFHLEVVLSNIPHFSVNNMEDGRTHHAEVTLVTPNLESRYILW